MNGNHTQPTRTHKSLAAGLMVAGATVGMLTAATAPAFASTTTVSTLASQIISVAEREQSPTGQLLAGPVLQVVKALSPSDWNIIMFGTTSLNSTQTKTNTALSGSVMSIVNFQIDPTKESDPTTMAQYTQTVEGDINQTVTEIQALDPTISQSDAVDFLSTLEQNIVNSMFGVALTAGPPSTTEVRAALGDAVASSMPAYPQIAALFSGSAAGSSGGSDSTGSAGTSGTVGSAVKATLGNLTQAFAKPLTKVDVGPTGGTFSTTTQGADIQVTVPSKAFVGNSQLTIETTKAGTDFSQVLPGAYRLHLAVSVSFGTVPQQGVTITVKDPHIQRGTALYELTSSGLQIVAATVDKGQASFTLNGNANLVFVTPDAAPKMKSTQRALMFDGKVENVVPAQVKNGTTYMPIWYVQHLLEGMGFSSNWSPQAWKLTAPSISTTGVKTVSPNQKSTGLYLNGKLIVNAPTMQAIDPSSGKPTTFMPIWYVQQLLNQVNIPSQWDGQSWFLAMNYVPTSAGASSSSTSTSSTGK